MLVKITTDKYEYKLPQLIEHVKKSPYIEETGAIFTFEGIMRKIGGEEVEKLTISHENPQKAQEELEKIAEEVKKKHKVKDIALVHFLGEFHATETLFMVVVGGAHRQETLKALSEIIERTKKEIGFRKEEYTKEGKRVILSGG
ncbi:molybdenum cofactor biosynthesis protein MoaE [Methanothermobacter tenebrarum]|uniref:Molybdenum cofactor biosynthesis protein MoaE n=1 Tax=Methanothermobacter tenebrarum TaxID=680118 RepID=A0A328PBH6_9EURY|nr:molybdenum cofactor biosynthesis protein MoaE [Methanothermobacter tenebrarum]MBC7117415.1 molybdenum cofactor biosynthesis protein MoaE [Methanobacteriaceae archaeon]NPV64707.1 molybdenum cofactor biosynthesis protein MoaE [Methanobacteriaceae archaeon]RAO79040.1 molybdenum cofactor biosynthesis protein MoaE [Methanothermobacter tenebrarum]